MKEIKEEIKREITDTHIHYEAVDGTRFTSQSECEKYENTAIGVLMARVKEFMIADEETADGDWLEDGSDNLHKTLVPKTLRDIDTLNQLWFLFGGKSKQEPMFSKEDLNTVIIMGYRWYKEGEFDWVWFYKFNEIVNDMTNGKYQLALKEKK